MNTEIEAWEGEGGAHRPIESTVALSTRGHRTLWIGVLYAAAIAVALAFVAKLY